MKKLFFGAFCAAAMLLTGCKGDDIPVEVAGNTATVCGTAITFPDGWSITSGDALYEELASMSGVTADEFEEIKSAEGITYFVQATAQDNAAIAVISAQDITPADGEEPISFADHARTTHDSMIFEYLASGYKTGDDSSFSEVEYGGKSGYLSHFEVFTKSEEPEFCLGFSEFSFQQDELIYTVQMCYFDRQLKQEAQSVIDSITAAQ